MLDAVIHGTVDGNLTALARRLGWHAAVFTFLGFAFGLGGLPLIATNHPLIGLAALIASRLIFAIAAHDGAGDADRKLAMLLRDISLAGYPFAFAIAAPEHGAACVFLIFGLAAMISARFAYPGAGDGRFAPGGFDFAAAFLLGVLVPGWFGLLAYLLGGLCFVAAGLAIDSGRAPGSGA